MQAQRRNKGTVLFILNLGARWEWVINAMPKSHNSQARAPVPTVQEAGWTPGSIKVGVEKRKSLAATRFPTLDRPACSELPYQLCYPSPTCDSTPENTFTLEIKIRILNNV